MWRSSCLRWRCTDEVESGRRQAPRKDSLVKLWPNQNAINIDSLTESPKLEHQDAGMLRRSDSRPTVPTSASNLPKPSSTSLPAYQSRRFNVSKTASRQGCTGARCSTWIATHSSNDNPPGVSSVPCKAASRRHRHRRSISKHIQTSTLRKHTSLVTISQGLQSSCSLACPERQDYRSTEYSHSPIIPACPTATRSACQSSAACHLVSSCGHFSAG